jgi:hypothetical protein
MSTHPDEPPGRVTQFQRLIGDKSVRLWTVLVLRHRTVRCIRVGLVLIGGWEAARRR